MLVAIDPKLSDGVDGWLNPAQAIRLKAAHILTLQHLVDAISGFGYRWHTKVPRISEKAAGQIVHWLTDPSTASALGVTLNARGLKTRSGLNRNGPDKVPAVYAARTGIVPLENLLIPRELDGATDNVVRKHRHGSQHFWYADPITSWWRPWRTNLRALRGRS